jgi:hypothetical protein
VAFESDANDLAPGDDNAFTDIYVRDRLLGTTILASIRPGSGASANWPSADPEVSAQGGRVFFQSDLFCRDLRQPELELVSRYQDVPCGVDDLIPYSLSDADSDGLPDDWEQAHWNSTQAKAAGDADQDGFTNKEELFLGTNPIDPNSCLRLSASAPGRTYNVQFKDQLSDPQWSILKSEVRAAAYTTWIEDATVVSGQTRFYRIVCPAAPIF